MEKNVYYNDVDGCNVRVSVLQPVNGIVIDVDDTILLLLENSDILYYISGDNFNIGVYTIYTGGYVNDKYTIN